MTRPAIIVEDLSKSYQIGRNAAASSTFREALVGAVKAPFNRLRRPGEEGYDRETFWALRDVSFEARPGEVIGIIGRNGAGKSTLLKVLSRIVDPTEGCVRLRGRVASLLEVGTGFHPELTGRENVYLNGSILGMRKVEIDRKFDEIVAFAGVEKFLDTPVKRYSSGMYVRLAFSVAAHLEPEILIVDEVLAVGDTDFQKKCLGKMREVSEGHGRTVLFVSHSMPAILRLCARVILLEKGHLIADGTASEVTRQYLSTGIERAAERSWKDQESAPGDHLARLRAVRVKDESGEVSESFDIRRPIAIEVEYWNMASELKPTVSIHLVNEDGVRLFVSNDFNNREWWNTAREPGIVRATCQIPGNFLAEGRLTVLAAVCSYNPEVIHAIYEDAVSFQVVDQSEGDGARGVYSKTWPGVLRPFLNWEVTLEREDALLPGAGPSTSRRLQ